MSLLAAIILGIVQGLTEFLPVSSSGHLVVVGQWLDVARHGVVFEVAVHVGTLLAILVYYRKTLWALLKSLATLFSAKKEKEKLNFILMIILGSIPTAVMGLALKGLFESLFAAPVFVGAALIVTGLVLFVTQKFFSKGEGGVDLNSENLGGAESMKWWQALVIGTAQGCAITPGISRSGSTIAAALVLGWNRQLASTYSFVLSIPAVLGATLLQFREIDQFASSDLLPLLVGLLSAFVSGLLGLWLVLHFVKKGRLEYFSYYLWILGPIVILFFS